MGTAERMKLEASGNVPIDLTENECLDLLQSHDLARIAFLFKESIEIFPINYCLDGAIIVFRTGLGTKLAAVGATTVAVEVDGWDPESGIGWSVIAKGRTEEITTNPGRVAEHLRWMPVHPAAPGERYHWVGIKTSAISGRRFHIAPAKRPGA